MNRKRVSILFVIISLVLTSVGCATQSDIGGSFSTSFSSSVSHGGAGNLNHHRNLSPHFLQQTVISTRLQFNPSAPLALVFDPHFPSE
ncbi:MAG: hypothetical protein P9L94_08385 [Candidatus Hinthialibacter antarcticus]|nr:hypothetical protein [Candidatus Hinthialibacter antarcticus]